MGITLTGHAWLQISGAMVKMSDAPRGVSERMLRLTGFPEQVQAAMNLVQVWFSACAATLAAPAVPLYDAVVFNSTLALCACCSLGIPSPGGMRRGSRLHIVSTSLW